MIVVYDPQDPKGNTMKLILAMWPECSVDVVICGIMELEYLNVGTLKEAAAWINGTYMLQPPHYGPETPGRLEQEGFFGTRWHWNGEAVFDLWAYLADAVLAETDYAARRSMAKL